MALFSKLIKCSNCQGNMKAKKEKNKRKYICSNYDNRNGKCDKRTAVEENYILELLGNRLDKETLTIEDVLGEVDYIEVYDKKKGREMDIYFLTIHMKNQEDIILSDKLIQL